MFEIYDDKTRYYNTFDTIDDLFDWLRPNRYKDEFYHLCDAQVYEKIWCDYRKMQKVSYKIKYYHPKVGEIIIGRTTSTGFRPYVVWETL